VPQLHVTVKIKITGDGFVYYLAVTAKSTVGQLVVIHLLFYCFFRQRMMRRSVIERENQ